MKPHNAQKRLWTTKDVPLCIVATVSTKQKETEERSSWRPETEAVNGSQKDFGRTRSLCVVRTTGTRTVSVIIRLAREPSDEWAGPAAVDGVPKTGGEWRGDGQQLRDDYDDRTAHGRHSDNDENERRTRGGGGTPARPVQRSVFERANAVSALHDMADGVSQCRQYRNTRERRDKLINIIPIRI